MKKMENKNIDDRKLWRAEAKEKAEAYLSRLRAAKTLSEKSRIKSKLKKSVKEWKDGLSTVDKKERKAQKKAYKAFKRRKNRTRRYIIWGAALAVAACVIISVAPIVSMLMKVMGSQQYVNSGEAVEAARAAGTGLSTEICDEGFVLLKNDDDFLPLTDNRKISIFGDDAYNFVYGGSGSAGADQSGAVTLFEAFEANGISYDRELDSAYRELLPDIGGGGGSIFEMILAFFTGGSEDSDWFELDESMIDASREYSDTALIVLSSQEVESSEVSLDLLQPMKKGTNKAALIKSVCEKFDHVIIIVNSGNVMELGFMEEYDSIDAALWVGSPGSQGCIELARTLVGGVNPSGRTVDTYPVSIEKEPAYITYGDNSYTNLDMHVFTYNEGIYVGYRYYETWFGHDAKAYKENVVYPFGHGLSYTEFSERITGFDADEDSIRVEVRVENTGDTAGKNVVELYFMPPYYEQSNIEKSAIELAAFGKTGELQPGQSETLTLTFDTRDMSSYSTQSGCYILERGEYRLAIGKNVHEALLSGDTYSYNVEADVMYKTDDATGTAITNLFGFAEGEVIYMSRSDKQGTFPQRQKQYVASDEVIAAKAEYEKAKTPYTEMYSAEPKYGAENGIALSDLGGLSYDDEKWELFLDQFTIDELITLMANGGWHTEEINRLGVPSARLLDGPSGINSMFSSLDAVAYPMETVVSSSWNVELARRLGEAIGDEANACGVNGWYAPAMNIHRTSIGGRNNEYYSEDPMLSGKFGAATVEGAQSKGVIAFMKHFVCNDVELNARSGVYVWVNEQSLREIYLRPFEMSVKEGGAAGAMTAFSHLGVEWCGGSSALLQTLLREEWGFEGAVTTDACLGGWMNAELAAKNGNDLMLEMGLQNSVGVLKKAYRRDPVGVAYGLRRCAHNICFAIVNMTNLCE